MACNCNKELTPSECSQMLKKHNDTRYTFIYHYFEDIRGLTFASVKKGENPNEVAARCGFYNKENKLEWFYTSEHPCINEQN